MKNLLRRTFSLLSTVAMTLTCLTAAPTLSFADTESSARDIECSHIEFVAGKDAEGGNTIKARAFVRDYSGNTDNVSLICASYDASGMLIGAGVSSGMNTVLSTGEYKTTDSVAKTIAYVWDTKTISPVTETATQGAEIIPTITFDGKSFEEYMGVDFDKNTTSYFKALEYKANPFTGDVKVTWPKVRVQLSDMSGSYQIINDEDKFTTTIRVFSGDRVVETKTLTKTSSADAETYTKAQKDYVINWTFPDGKFLGDSLVSGEHLYGPAEEYFTCKTVAEVDKGEVSFNVSGLASNNLGILIVKPANGNASKDIVVADANDTALTWTRSDECGRVAYDEATGVSTYGERSEGTPVTLSANGKATKTVRVDRATFATDNSYVTGCAARSDRFPAQGAQHVAYMASDLVGYNFIPISAQGDLWNNFGTSAINVKFFVNAPAELIWLTQKEIMPDNYQWTKSYASTTSAESELASQNRTFDGKWTKCFATTRRLNPCSVYTAAKAIRELDVPQSEFFFNIYNQTADFKLSDGSTIKAQLYSPVRYNDLYAMSEAYGDKSLVPVSASSVAANYKTLANVLGAMVDKVYGATNEMGDVIKDLTRDYSGIGRIDNAVKEFPIAGEDGMFVDRVPVEFNYTGALLKYPDALELDGLKFVSPCINWINAQNQTAADYTGEARTDYKGVVYNPNPDFDGKWFSFTAKDDCEVIILTTGEDGDYLPNMPENSGWISASIGSDDAMKIVNTLDYDLPGIFDVPCLYLKKFSAGEKVQIYKGGGHKFVFARRLAATVTSEDGAETEIGAANVEITAPVLVNNVAKRDEGGNIIFEVNKEHSEMANKINKLALNTGGTGANSSAEGLGSQVAYDRNYPVNADGYTNDVRSVRDDYKDILGSDYIMTRAAITQRSTNGWETSFTLYKDATVAVFSEGLNAANVTKNGWAYKQAYNGQQTLMTVRLDNLYNLGFVSYKHFNVTDKTNGLKVTIPREMFCTNADNIDNPSGKTSGLTLAVIYYD